MLTNDPSQLILVFALVGIIMICVVLCIVKIYSELKNLTYRIEIISKDVHRIADEVAPKDKK